MKFGFSLVVRGSDATPESSARMGERAEALELDSLWCSAHVIIPPQVKSGYSLVPGLKHPEHWKERYWEPFTVLNYLAAVTSRIQLGTSVVVMPMHNLFELAKQVAEVDQVSGGRLVVGIGWFEEEFGLLGQDFHNRGARTNDGLELMKAPVDIADAIKRYRDLGAPHSVLDVVPETRAVALDTMDRCAQEVRSRLI
jgi:alkanesulfonate monooxygenase SsuD/methylene tetrahydromethanopterin reductase-like flavin-dependent oxidoreductase (luciferase family)